MIDTLTTWFYNASLFAISLMVLTPTLVMWIGVAWLSTLSQKTQLFVQLIVFVLIIAPIGWILFAFFAPGCYYGWFGMGDTYSVNKGRCPMSRAAYEAGFESDYKWLKQLPSTELKKIVDTENHAASTARELLTEREAVEKFATMTSKELELVDRYAGDVRVNDDRGPAAIYYGKTYPFEYRRLARAEIKKREQSSIEPKTQLSPFVADEIAKMAEKLAREAKK